MSDITIIVEKINKAMLMHMSLTTETREDPTDASKEQYRAIFRVTTKQEALDVKTVSSPTACISEAATLDVRFNSDSVVTLYPLSDFEPFKLVSQTYEPYDVKGSRFFSGTKEWVSVSGQWMGLEWSSR